MNEETPARQSGAAFAEAVDRAPSGPGVYLLKDKQGRVIYIGKARSLRERLKAYTQAQEASAARPKADPRLQALVSRVQGLDTIITRSETEALVLEENLIKIKKPKFNVRLRDDKKFPYLKITVQERFPRIFPTRNIRPDGSLLFGPYTSAKDLRRALKGVKRIFRMRTCYYRLPEDRPDRPCLNFQLSRCSAPCREDADPDEYRQRVNDVVDLLAGRSDKLITELEQRMWRESQDRNFERAAVLRDQLMSLREIRKNQQAVSTDKTSRDVIGIARGDKVTVAVMFRVREGKIVGREEYPLTASSDASNSEVLATVLRSVHTHTSDIPDEIVLPSPVEDTATFEQLLSQRHGRRTRILVPERGERVGLLELARRNAEKSLVEVAPEDHVPKAAQELASLLGLGSPPRVIEGVDISNTQGRNPVGSIVVFHDSKPARSRYRHFKIRTVAGPDDFAMVEEVLTRRVRGLLERQERLPDLVLVDGGKGQLSSAVRAYHSFDQDIPILGLAKRTDTVYYADGREISVPVSSPALKLLKRIRDESHRFAITHHRKLRGKQMVESELDAVRGIGPARRKALIRHFGSLKKLKLASPDDIAKVKGFGPALAEKVHEQLRS